MNITIKEIAKMTGVSIATVSHVINKTRYVSPELTQKVERAIYETGYINKIRKNQFKFGRRSRMAFVLPTTNSTVYAQLANTMTELLAKEGYILSTYVSHDNEEYEKHILMNLLADKNIAGIFLSPTVNASRIYTKVKRSGIPFMCVERKTKDGEIPAILSENEEAMFRGTRHLIRSGHKLIGILLEDCDLIHCQERLAGYRRALEEYKVPFDKGLVCRVDLYCQEEENIFEKARFDTLPSAFIAAGNTLTLKLLKNADDYGLKCPDDISIVGFGDDEWSSIFNPSLTILRQDTASTAKRAVEMMMELLKGNPAAQTAVRMPVGFTVRKSTRVINRGPFGEIAVPPENILVDTAEEEYLKKEQFKVAIAFHCTDTEWSRLQKTGIRDTLARYNVQVIAVMDANFNAQLQVTQLEALRMQKPDAIIGVPVDENITAGKFKELSRLTKMILIGNIPQGIDKNDYYSCVSVNERENGQNAGNILGEYFKERTDVKLGLLNHGLPFHMTRQRDNAAEQVLTENYTNLQIVSRKNFYQIQNVYDTCMQMMREHPEISGLYVSWERPAMEAIRALRTLGRTDVAISTVDLDLEIASYMARGEMVRGISAQRPYEQGEAAAMVTIQALLGKKGYKFVGVQPVVVYPRELTRYWREIIRKPAPEFLKPHKNR